MYYILDYFGILFILDINSVLIQYILWIQRLSEGFVLRNILGTKVRLNNFFSVLNIVLNFLLINIENS